MVSISLLFNYFKLLILQQMILDRDMSFNL